jgi:hypothetical protein
VFVINLTDQTLMFTGEQLSNEIKTLRLPREALKQLMEQLAEEKGGANGER